MGSVSSGQFGVRRGKGSREIIGMLRITSERTLDIDEEMCACLTGWQNVFDRVNWTELMQIMNRSNMTWRQRRLISKLYVDQSATLWLAHWKKTSVNTGSGVREGCLLAILFNLQSEHLTKKALERKYTDDLVLLATV